MTFAVLLAATLVVAAADWWAVATDRRRIEYVLKPATMVVLIAATVAITSPDPPAARWWMVAGLVASLAGDVFLMVENRFVEGLASFLVGHVMYVVGLSRMGLEPVAVVIGLVAVAVGMVVVGRQVVVGADEHDARLKIPVALYMAVISAMVVTAFGTTRPAAIIGALLFYGSDAVIGWSRFVGEVPHHRVIIMTTYHLGQIGLVLSLLGAT